MSEVVAASSRASWKWVTLADVGKVITGNTPPTTDVDNYGDAIPFVKPTELVDRGVRSAPNGLAKQALGKARVVPAGAVLVSCIGNLGKTGLAKVPVAFNQQINAVVFNENVIPEFGFYYAQTLKSWLYDQSSATTIPIINKGKFQQARFPLAPIAEQREIVAELEKQFSRLDEAVANLQRVKANLKRYKASVLKAAVEGRLVETEASLAHREGRSYETGVQLLQRILEERRAKWAGRGKFKEPVPCTATDGDLTAGWAWAAYSQLGDVTTGFTPPTGDAANFGGVTPFFKPTDLDAGDNVHIAREYLTEAGLQKGRKLPAGSVLVTCIGATIGKAGLAAVDCATNQQINSVSPVADCVDSRYLFWWTSSPKGHEQIVDNASATTLPILNKSKFEALSVALPPFAEQIRIVAEVDRLLSIVREVEAEVDTNLKRALALRQATLAKAFQGDQRE